MVELSASDFPDFFQSIHNRPPFPWQRRLAEQVANEGEWPEVLDLPTGSGKTSAIDVAVFHLALEANRGEQRRAPVRLAFVVDRRLVVDDAFARAERIERALVEAPPGSVVAHVAERLQYLAGDGPPLLARRLRGGIPRESDWARTPAQPTVLCTTVDQIGSRLLFRGYGISDRMKPVHAGLIGSDCLILLDEAHLAEPFRQTLSWVAQYRGERWRDPKHGHASPWGMATLTATPGEWSKSTFSLDPVQDREHPVLSARLNARKPARLVEAADPIKTLVAETRSAVDDLVSDGLDVPAAAVVVNRVATARKIFNALAADEASDVILMIGPARAVDRDELAARLTPIGTGASRDIERPLILVSTQCIEAGVDIDLDGLITEAAPLDSLRQRFGRLNRAGRPITPRAAVVAGKATLGKRYEDPVYGSAIAAAWQYLQAGAKKVGKGAVEFDFGYQAFEHHVTKQPIPGDALSPKADAPVLLPAHLDLLAQTSPIPASDPEVSLYLHGEKRQSDSVTVVWRADMFPGGDAGNEQARRLLTLVPPRTGEAIELPRWAVRRWLERDREALDQLADVGGADSAPDAGTAGDSARKVFRWRGDDPQSRWIDPQELRDGDTVVVPAGYGGADDHGWNPVQDEHELVPAKDVADRAAAPFAGSRYAVRVAPGLLDDQQAAPALASVLAAAPSSHWRELRDAVALLPLPETTQSFLAALDAARGGVVRAIDDIYGYDERGRPRGIVFLAPFGLKLPAEDAERQEPEYRAATEDDYYGSLPGYALTLQAHSDDVERKAEAFARAAGLPPARVNDLALAGYLHDAGKADTRFQAWLHNDDPLGPDPDDPRQILAKSARPLPRSAREAAALPPRWRHEALSVRLALGSSRLVEANDPELVIWLIGVHHGHGRPFFPHEDLQDLTERRLPAAGLSIPGSLPPGHGPQSLAFNWQGLDWGGLYARLKQRYGVWELARMEAVLRLAD
ncbi:MAG TPA: type I-U CRISPR-associated helicase/endonuclease Cas3, partial [Gammaproteobacteria bacterium]|nr:type I-U CRISPR-associated helicase/endonuclease Cas3 [Gammaproteobacteria bacterium]